jgi:hypothetical protein
MGNDLSDAEIDGAARQLVETGLKVVVLATFETEISRILIRVKAVIDAAGHDYLSYSWIVPTISTADLLQTSMTRAELNEDPSVLKLFEGILGVNIRLPYSERGIVMKVGDTYRSRRFVFRRFSVSLPAPWRVQSAPRVK